MKKGGSFQKERVFIFLNRRWGVDPQNLPRAYATAYMPLKETPIIYCFTATEITKMRFKRHIAKVNLPLLLHHNQSISRLNKKVGWNRRNVGNFCKLEGRANKRRINLKKISFHCISNRQGGGLTPEPSPLLRTPLSTTTIVRAAQIGRAKKGLPVLRCPVFHRKYR